MKGAKPGNDSKNLVTHYFAACGVSLALPFLEYTLVKTASYKAPNVLTDESQNSITSDIGSASCVLPSSVYVLNREDH